MTFISVNQDTHSVLQSQTPLPPGTTALLLQQI